MQRERYGQPKQGSNFEASLAEAQAENFKLRDQLRTAENKLQSIQGSSEQADKLDSLTRQVNLLRESLGSTAINLTKQSQENPFNSDKADRLNQQVEFLETRLAESESK